MKKFAHNKIGYIKTFAISLFVVCISILQISCGTSGLAFLDGLNRGLSNSYTPQNQTTKLMLFGGLNHETYLGCLNCNQYSIDSIFNKYGNHGNKYSATSIWNNYGEFGSRYSIYSPWNPHASDPPVIVDNDGNFYGRFTSNKFHPQRTKIPSIVDFLDRASIVQ